MIRFIPNWLIGIFTILIVVRLMLPAIGFWAINKALSEKLGHYTGHITDFDLSLYRGAYQIEGLEIKKKDSRLLPLVKIDNIDLSLAWRALLRKEITGDIKLFGAAVNLADSRNDDRKQFGNEDSKDRWQNVFAVLIPISVESLLIKDSKISFLNSDLKQSLPIQLENIELWAKELRTKNNNVASPVSLTALLQRHAVVKLDGKIDVMTSPIKADIELSLRGFNLNTINSILMAYLPLDITKGQLDLYMEVALKESQAVGYGKIFLKDADILARKQRFVSVKHFFYEIAAALGNWILENNKTKKVAAIIPFEYGNSNFNINASRAFWSAVQNKQEILKSGFENSIDMTSFKK